MRFLGEVIRADGRRESMTFAVSELPDGGQSATDFRTEDGAPLVLNTDDAMTFSIGEEPMTEAEAHDVGARIADGFLSRLRRRRP